MNFMRKLIIVFVFMLICPFNAFGDNASSQKASGRHHRPPPEAYEACEGKNPGDAARFLGPCGETVTGICEQEGDRLVLRPDHPKAHSCGRRHGPTPEAYEACEGKRAGDSAQFIGPRGETIAGTCEQEGGRLVLRPDRPPRKNADEGTADEAGE